MLIDYTNLSNTNCNINLLIQGFWINDIGEGGCKEDKFERDIRLLSKGIEEEPNNPRYYFYLAHYILHIFIGKFKSLGFLINP